MKRNELKKVLKPLIKECIKEVIFDEGVLSGLISEVLKGTGNDTQIRIKQPRKEEDKMFVGLNKMKYLDKTSHRLQETKQKMVEAIGKDAYNGVNLFEGTSPMGREEAAPAAGSVDLGNARDQGVDISSLVGGASRMWDAMK